MTILTTAGLQESIEKGWPLATLAAIDHPIDEVIETWPDGIIRLWDGVGVLQYDGKDWRGIGPFGRVTGVGGAKQLLIRAVTFELTGIPAVHSVYLDKRLRNRPAQAWTAGMDARGSRVNGEAFQEVDGLIDYTTHAADESGVQTISLVIREPVFSIERAQNLSYTPEWANDYLQAWRDTNLAGERITGYDRIAELADATRSWTKE